MTTIYMLAYSLEYYIEGGEKGTGFTSIPQVEDQHHHHHQHQHQWPQCPRACGGLSRLSPRSAMETFPLRQYWARSARSSSAKYLVDRHRAGDKICWWPPSSCLIIMPLTRTMHSSGGWVLLRSVRCSCHGSTHSHCCRQLCKLL